FHVGECQFYLEEYEKAQEQFEKAKSLNASAHPDINYMLGRCYQRKGKLDEAIVEYTAAKALNMANPTKTKEIDYYTNQCQTAKSLMAAPKNVQVTNLGGAVNSPYDDKRPSITGDGKTMIFTSRRPEGKSDRVDTEGDNKYYEDIYECPWDSAKMTWGDANLLRGSVNSEGHDAACSIAPDGKMLFMYVNDVEAARGGEIYTSKKSGSGKWSTPQAMKKGVNTSYFEDGAVLSPDGNTLYFMSERGQDLPYKGQKGYGRSDIWMAKKEGKGWGDAVNLGPTINTEYDEGGIFPAPDGKTLYFCSNGHNSMGGYDIFMTRFENGAWTTPVNMGYPINTIGNERMFLLSKDGTTAYVDSDREGGLGERDIWIIDMSGMLAKKKEGPTMSLITGTVYNGDGRAISADISVSENGSPVTTGKSEGGNYQMELVGDKTYEITVSAGGYKTVKETVKLDADKEGGTFELVKHFILYKE
ncbi:MAG TPA: carboxypeptidase regulatory-like domain-containing protein, partial [Bacteroidia bacterium]|nr:carboxypeptidase regulatory-like domain-containing protein [Bacteroidia bacterium]